LSARRVPLLILVALTATTLIGLCAGSAGAASTKVLLVTRGEEGEGPPAAQGEMAHITNFVRWPAQAAVCGGTDEAGKVGKNPSPTVKVAGSEAPVPASCFSESSFEALPGAITIKSVSLARSGAVKLMGRFEVTAGECSYRATKLTGILTFEEEQQFTDTLSGTAKLAPRSPKTCAKTAPVEDIVGVANAAGYNYLVRLTP
jgi:hypothetical protein